MKLVEQDGGRRVFALSGREKTLLERLLAFFPLRSVEGARLTREPSEAMADADELLRESLGERRVELASWMRLHLSEGEVFQKAASGWRLQVTDADLERLLQILNDLRVGSWVRLGCPEDIDSESLGRVGGGVPYVDIMILSGHFQSHLLSDMDESGREKAGDGLEQV